LWDLISVARSSAPRLAWIRRGTRLVAALFLLFPSQLSWAQSAPVSADRPWHALWEKRIEGDTKNFPASRFRPDPARTYSLPELIDLAETYNPETRFAWERARSQAAALGIARSELYPTLAAVALSQTNRADDLSASGFVRQTIQDFQVALDLNYTVFDFGARSGRIDAAKAQMLAANFAFNDTHRKVIYQVEQAYYRLLNAMGQEDAARASLSNAQTVQQAAEDRLAHGLATLPDVLEARSATAQTEFDLQAVVGSEEIARGDLAMALGTSPTLIIHVQPLDQVPTPDAIGDSVDQAIDRALVKRPDLLQQVAETRSANARIKETRAAYYPTLTFNVSSAAQSSYGSQQHLPWAHATGLVGAMSFNLWWNVFDGGARKNRLTQARADAHAAQAQASVLHDRITDEVWTAYSNLNTTFRQRKASLALLEAARQSYAAALESYDYGLRNLLDVTATQRTLAQARSAEVLARTQVLSALADLTFRTGDSIQNASKP